jgi:hypothetical protein
MIDIPETHAFLDNPGESGGTEPPPTNPSAGDHTTPVSSLIISKRVTVDDANLQPVVKNNGHAEMETISTPQKNQRQYYFQLKYNNLTLYNLFHNKTNFT